MADCCELLPLVLERSYERRGLELAPFFSLTGKATGDAVIVHFKRGKKDAPHASATYAQLSFCPFCGVRLERATPKKAKARK